MNEKDTSFCGFLKKSEEVVIVYKKVQIYNKNT